MIYIMNTITFTDVRRVYTPLWFFVLDEMYLKNMFEDPNEVAKLNYVKKSGKKSSFGTEKFKLC